MGPLTLLGAAHSPLDHHLHKAVLPNIQFQIVYCVQYQIVYDQYQLVQLRLFLPVRIVSILIFVSLLLHLQHQSFSSDLKPHMTNMSGQHDGEGSQKGKKTAACSLCSCHFMQICSMEDTYLFCSSSLFKLEGFTRDMFIDFFLYL